MSEVSKKPPSSTDKDPWKIILIMYRILREFNDTNSLSNIVDEQIPFPASSPHAPSDATSIINFGQDNNHNLNTQVKDEPDLVQSFSSLRDDNNNTVPPKIKQEEKRNSTEDVSSDHDKQSEDYRFSHTEVSLNSDETSRRSLTNNVEDSCDEIIENHKSEIECRISKSTETKDCSCSEDKICSEIEDCGYACVQKTSKIEEYELVNRFVHCQCDGVRSPFKNIVKDISTSIQNTFDTIQISRTLRTEGTSDQCYKSWQTPETTKLMKASSSEKEPKFIICRKANHEDEGTIRHIDSEPMLITKDQGLLEIHIIRLQLSPIALGILSSERNIHELSLLVSWNIWNQKTASTPSLKHPELNFNSSSIYRLPELFKFFEHVLGQSVSFSINVSRSDQSSSYAVAEANLNFKDILDNPQKKLHYTENCTSIIPSSLGDDFGQLSLWIRLSCDLNKLRSFKEQRGIFGGKLSELEGPKIESDEKIIHQVTSDPELNERSVSPRLHASIRNSLVQSKRSSKVLSTSSRIDSNIFFDAREPSRQSKESEASSLPRKRSQPNSSPIGNASPRLSSVTDSYDTISPSIVQQSDSSNIRAMEDEDATSSDFQNAVKKREIGSSKQIVIKEEKSKEFYAEKRRTDSINEFNNLIRNAIPSPRESSASVQDVGSVIADDKWNEYKRRSLASQARPPKPSILTTDTESRSRTSRLFSDRSINNTDAVIIRIESLSLFQKCSILEDPEIHQLYVEFSFLGHSGVNLETISVPKPSDDTPALFNYMRNFEIDEEQHSTERNIMRTMMTENDKSTIKFTIVSEPLPEEMETKECLEVGYAYFDIRDHILSGRFKEVELRVMNAEEIEPIGILKINLLGADAIRRCISDL